MPRITIQVKGVKQTQAGLKRNARQTQEALGASVEDTTNALYRTMTGVVHVDTGALRSSIRKSYQTSGRNAGITSQVFIDASTRNPKGGRLAVYGYFENKRGGSHAFIDMTLRSVTPGINSIIAGRFSSLK